MANSLIWITKKAKKRFYFKILILFLIIYVLIFVTNNKNTEENNIGNDILEKIAEKNNISIDQIIVPKINENNVSEPIILSNSVIITGVPFDTYLRTADSNFTPLFTKKIWNKLEDNIIITDKGITNEMQFLRFRDTSDVIETGRVLLGNDREGTVTAFFIVKRGDDIFEYEIKFENGLKSKIEKNRLVDLSDKTINILGKNYKIFDTEINVTNNNEIMMDLIGGSKNLSSLLLVEGNEYYIEIEGTNLTIIPIISDNYEKVIFNVNGKDTKSLVKGNTDEIVNDFIIGVVDVIPTEDEESSTGDLVLVNIGLNIRGKLKLRDNNFGDDEFYNGGIEIDGENIDNGLIKFNAQYDNIKNEYSINSIKYRLRPNNIIYVKPGTNLAGYLLDPRAMFFDFFYNGIQKNLPSTSGKGNATYGGTNFSIFLKIYSTDEDEYKMKFKTRDNKEYDIHFFNSSLGYGDANGERIVFQESNGRGNLNFRISDVIILNNKNDKLGQSHILRYSGYDSTTDIIDFTDLYNDDSIKVQMFNSTAQNLSGEIILSGSTYQIHKRTQNEDNLSIDLNGDNDFNSDNVSIVLKNGIRIVYGTPLKIVRQGNDFTPSRTDQVTNISLSQAGVMNAELQTSVDLTIKSIGYNGLELPGAINGLSGEKVGITSYGEIYLQKDTDRVRNDIYAIEHSGSYSIVNGVKVYTPVTNSQGLVNFEIR